MRLRLAIVFALVVLALLPVACAEDENWQSMDLSEQWYAMGGFSPSSDCFEATEVGSWVLFNFNNLAFGEDREIEIVLDSAPNDTNVGYVWRVYGSNSAGELLEALTMYPDSDGWVSGLEAPHTNTLNIKQYNFVRIYLYSSSGGSWAGIKYSAYYNAAEIDPETGDILTTTYYTRDDNFNILATVYNTRPQNTYYLTIYDPYGNQADRVSFESDGYQTTTQYHYTQSVGDIIGVDGQCEVRLTYYNDTLGEEILLANQIFQVITGGGYTPVPEDLYPYNLTIHAHVAGSENNSTQIYKFYAQLDEEYAAGTETGTIVFTGLENGTHEVVVWGEYYEPSIYNITIAGNDTSLNALLRTATAETTPTLQLTTFKVVRGFVAQPDTLIAIYYRNTFQQARTTGSDGKAAFYLLPSREYTIRINNTERILKLTPTESAYIIRLPATSIDITTTPPEFTPNTTGNNTSLIGTINNTTLTSIGLGSLGRGIVASAVVWVGTAGSAYMRMGMGVPVVGLIILVVLAILGFTSWFVVLLALLTVLAVYVLQRGGIG